MPGAGKYEGRLQKSRAALIAAAVAIALILAGITYLSGA
jgi:hypothetical protein